jgi:hypothetical protein
MLAFTIESVLVIQLRRFSSDQPQRFSLEIFLST